jgi:hypothetical protein
MTISMIEDTSKGQIAAFFLFCLTTAQLVFQQPYFVILPDERAQVFSGTLCWLTLAVTIMIGRGKNRFGFGVDFWISLILSLIAILSGIFSVVPRQSLERVYVILAAGLGGYWCSKLLLTEPNLRKMFLWLVNGLLLIVIFLALLGLYLTGKPHEFIDSHWHPVGSRLLLMSFAPLALLFGGDARVHKVIGGIILFLDLVAVYFVGRYAFIQSILIIPGILSVLSLFLFRWTPLTRRILVAILLVTVTSAVIFAYLNPKKLNRDHISVSYRIESLFFSLDIASKHPWLGNGLWSPRDSLLKDYKLFYPYLSKRQFSNWVIEYRTSENLYLTFLADLGIPFVILYFGSLSYILIGLLRLNPDQTSGIMFHPVAIFLPLVGECLTFLVVDDLFHPQISWFFHVLLGISVIGITGKKTPN